MFLDDRPLLGAAIQERDIDLILVQLIETAPAFRRWICTQLQPEIRIDQFLSVSRSVETTTGESDIEIAIKTASDQRCLFLIENKINAELQDKQAERYFQRGKQYVERDICDDFEVGLIAPDNYISQSDRDAFGTAVSYEMILEKLKTLSHDSIPFVEVLLEEAIKKQATGHNACPEVTKIIQTRFEERTDEFPEIELYDQSSNLVRFRSTNSNHPETVQYTIWVVGNTEGRETMIRLSLDSDASEEDIHSLQRIVANHFDEIDGFDLHEDSTMWTARTSVTTGRDKRPTNDEYIDEIVSVLHQLVTCYHPRFVEADLY